LTTISQAIEDDRDRITLPPRLLAEVQAEAHSWIGSCSYAKGDYREARRQLGKSLQFNPWQLSVLFRYALCALPRGLINALRQLRRAGKRDKRAENPRVPTIPPAGEARGQLAIAANPGKSV